jgi:hypothetical protein
LRLSRQGKPEIPLDSKKSSGISGFLALDFLLMIFLLYAAAAAALNAGFGAKAD